MTIQEFKNKKLKAEKIVMLTAYDHPMASLIDEAGVDVVLVGDSLANVVLGLESTKQVGIEEMLHHAKAVRRAVKKAMVVGDMPFSSYQEHPEQAVVNARRFIKEAGCDAIKLEWFDQCLEVTEAIIQSGIPVMGHVGLTPQTAEQLGGMKVQGKDAVSAQKIFDESVALERKGCFGIVIECIPSPLAKSITEKLKIPTIGIGAGVDCDGQVLVINDLLGLTHKYYPKFVKPYAQISQEILRGVRQYADEVRASKFPDTEHSYRMDEGELKKLKVS